MQDPLFPCVRIRYHDYISGVDNTDMTQGSKLKVKYSDILSNGSQCKLLFLF